MLSVATVCPHSASVQVSTHPAELSQSNMCHSPAIILLSLTLPTTLAVQPVNRYFSAESASAKPDLECLVGIDSADVSELYKVRIN